MKLKSNKYYEDRRGEIEGPLIRSVGSGTRSFENNRTGDEYKTWFSDGRYYSTGTSPNDLIREVPGPQPLDPKGDAGKLKPQLGLIPTVAMVACAGALSQGAAKYGEANWRHDKVCASTYVHAMLRHLTAYRDKEDNDPDSGVSHLGHVMASCAILLDAAKHETLEDDRV